MWWFEPGITQPFASTSLWNTICPVSGHLIHRLSGLSRLNSVLILGRTTSEIQFIAVLSFAPRQASPGAAGRLIGLGPGLKLLDTLLQIGDVGIDALTQPRHLVI